MLRPELWERFVNQFRFDADFDGGWRCEYWGKMMRGACMTYSYTQNEQLYEILLSAVKGLIATQEPSAKKYFKTSALGKLSIPCL